MAAASSGSWASPRAAPPGATSAQRPGRSREQATRTRPADAVPEPAAPATAITRPVAGAQRAVPGSTPGWPGWLATRASSPDMQDNKAGNIPLRSRCLPAAADDRTENVEAAASPHTTRIRGRLGHCQAPDHPAGCRICPHPPRATRCAVGAERAAGQRRPGQAERLTQISLIVTSKPHPNHLIPAPLSAQLARNGSGLGVLHRGHWRICGWRPARAS